VRKLAILAVAAVVTATVLAGLAVTLGLVHVYGVGNGALNSGVVVGTDGHNVGFEWAGTPGLFVDAS